MTRDELYRKRMMFQIYSSRNHMPKFETNANNEPLKHSATNDYLEYRKKVAAGVRMQKENDKSNLFNVTEANEQYYQDLMDQNIIVHAGTYKPAGTHEYVAVLPDFWGKGKHRYFYTQEEWDSYNKNKAASGQAGAQRGAKEGADAKNKALASAGQKAYESSLSNPAKNAFGKAITNINNKSTAAKGQKAYEESQKNNAYNQAQSGREAAIRNSQGGSKEYDEEAQNITNTVKNYGKNKGYAENAGAARGSQEAANGNKESNFNTNQKQSANQSGSANAAKAQGEAYDKYMADKKQSANQSGSANAAKAQGEAYDQYMQEQEEELANIKKSVKDYNANRKEWEKNSQANPGAQRGARESELVNNKKQSANQSGSANSAKAEGEGYDRYKKDLADKEELRRQVEQEEINAENYAKNKSDSKGIDKAAKDRAIKESADSILNSKNPAKEIANNKTISKDIDVIVDMLNAGVADFNKDGRIHIDKSKNPKAVEYIANSDLGAMYNALLKGGMSKRSIDAAINDEIEKRYNASKESKVQNAVGKFAQKGGQRDIANAVKGMSDSKAQHLAANQSGSGNAAKEAGERQDADKAKKAREEEDAKAKRYDDRYEKNNGKKRYATSVKHFAFEEDDEETEEITPEQEYLNFRAKVEAGMKHFGMTRNLMSIPVNQGLKNGESLIHATPGITNKYYVKLDDFWGKGKPRYFYSKEEWDGYQRNKQGAAQAGAQRGAKEGAHAKNQSLANQAGNAYQSSYRNNLLNKAQSGREAAIKNSGSLVSESSGNTPTPFKNLAQTAKRTALLAQAQSGREAAIKNSGSLGGTNTNNDGSSNVTVVIEKIPENVQIAQSGREEDERAATKRTMISMAYDKAVRDYNEVAKEIDSEYGFDKVESQKDLVKAYTDLIKDTEKVIAKGKVPNPDNVKYESQITGDTAQYAAYIQEYASELLRLESVKQDLQNEYSKTIDLASAQTGDGFVQSHQRATELFNQMMDVNDQINWLSKESMAKVYPYLTAVYRELI